MTDVHTFGWVVVWKVDAEPIEVYPFDDFASAFVFYEQARMSWSQVYLCTVVHGPGPGWPGLEAPPAHPRLRETE